jgi:hypothetical protein
MKKYEVLLSIPKERVDSVVLALFYGGFDVYEPAYTEGEVTVAFSATDEQVQEVK